MRRERCAALDDDSNRCKRTLTKREVYHGDAELYGELHGVTPRWVVVAFCKEHRKDEKKPSKGNR